MSDPFVRYPTSVKAGGAQDMLVYERVHDHFAAEVAPTGGPTGRAVARIGDTPGLTIFEGNADRAAIRGNLLPVYRLAPNGALSVPTGSIFVRFGDGASVSDHEDALDAADYRIVSVPSYAPNAAWLESKHGDAADALTNIAKLMVLPGLVRVEPQMLSAAARKDG